MIVDTPAAGDEIVIKGIPTDRFQALLESIERHINGTETDSYTVATVPPAADYIGASIYVSDETGGATIAFSDGTNWRRVQDRAIIS